MEPYDPVSTGQQDSYFVYFVGNAVSFSATVLRTAEAELSEISFRRATSLAEFRDVSMDHAANTLAAIVDESLFPDFLHEISGLGTVFPNTLFAVAYRNAETVRNLMSQNAFDIYCYNVSFLPMNIHFDSWVSILRLILGGQGYIPRELFAPPIETAAIQTSIPHPSTYHADDTSVHGNLTEREIEVLSYVAEGKQNKVIAHELGLSEHTVKLHIHHVIAKLGVCNRTEAAAWFFEHRNLLNAAFRK